jgi:hypothetical protein
LRCLLACSRSVGAPARTPPRGVSRFNYTETTACIAGPSDLRGG